MKELMQQAMSLLMFDMPIQPDYIRSTFTTTHLNYQQVFLHWSPEATRKKLIAAFWYRQVLFHFALMISLAFVVAILSGMASFKLLLVTFFPVGIILLITFSFFLYLPFYYRDFLPTLDMVMAEKEKSVLADETLKKCKRSQHSIPSLTIIFFVFCKLSGVTVPPANDPSAMLLNSLLGVDKDKLKQNLSRLQKISRLTPKEKAELQKGIEVARQFFAALDAA
ncbi:hypothetical protein QWZ08_05750, partial [Ferruginibacter paludis]|uniref:hypothetical protein n=1 Tax=Ferruginibacter paludis TaxID=1310417 RepID=UPI0025B47CDF